MIFFTILVSVLLCFGSQSEYSHFKIRSAKAVAASFTGSQQNHTARADFIVMKQIIIFSKKHGKFIVKVDDDDFERVNKFKWSIACLNKNYSVVRGRQPRSMASFIMNAKNGAHINHLDSNSLNNCKSNLNFCRINLYKNQYFIDGEIWRGVMNYNHLYLVSNHGRIKTIKNYVLAITLNNCGYLQVGLSTNGYTKLLLVHRLVAQAFIPNPKNKKTVNHKNGIKTDNRVENLEWNTYSENIKHAYSSGLKKNNPENIGKLKWEDVKKIRYMYAAGVNSRILAEKFKVTMSCIQGIVARRKWKTTSLCYSQ